MLFLLSFEDIYHNAPYNLQPETNLPASRIILLSNP